MDESTTKPGITIPDDAPIFDRNTVKLDANGDVDTSTAVGSTTVGFSRYEPDMSGVRRAYAAAALPGIIEQLTKSEVPFTERWYQRLGEVSYRVADAMLEAEKTTKE